ncbi:MAG: hypothetical protein QME61_01200 [Patescibacteria group bacterium]|nr:hypothetical protein [Patescibacteria group bacterium]
MKRNFKKFFLALILLGILLPFYSVQAGWLTDRVVDILKTFAAFIIEVLAKLLDLAYGILNWVISPDFLGVSMTGPDNPIVTSGWRTIRNLAYLILILATIIIIFGIILGIREYEAKKTLPVLIIIALLINFTPVICGVFIDFSNVLMKYFLSGGLAGGFSQAVKDGFEKARGFDEPLSIIVNALAFIIFGIIGIVVFLLYALLFAMRYVALWILIIFSPIAFISRVFPPSDRIKKFFPSIFHWDEWWNRFIQWCIIGIFGAFFIYLANNLMVKWITELSPKKYSPIGGLYAYFFPIILLLIGFFTTLTTAQSVAQEAISRAKQIAGWTGKVVKPLRKTAPIRGIEERARKIGERIREAPIIGGTARMRAEAEARHREAREKRIEGIKSRLATMSPETAEMFAKTPEERAALFKLKAERGKLEDKDIIGKRKTLTGKEIKNIDYIKPYLAPKDLEEAAKRRPDLIPELQKEKYDTQVGINIAKGLSPKVAKEKARATLINETVKKMFPLDFRRTVQAGALKNFEVAKSMSVEQMREIGRRGSDAQKMALQDMLAANMREFNNAIARATGPEKARLEELKRTIKSF